MRKSGKRKIRRESKLERWLRAIAGELGEVAVTVILHVRGRVK